MTPNLTPDPWACRHCGENADIRLHGRGWCDRLARNLPPDADPPVLCVQPHEPTCPSVLHQLLPCDCGMRPVSTLTMGTALQVLAEVILTGSGAVNFALSALLRDALLRGETIRSTAGDFAVRL